MKITFTLLLFISFILWAYYAYKNTEKYTLDSQARKQLGGDYLQIPLGVVHYELAGDEAADIVVMVHGLSVPAFLWEPTFQFLKARGYRVLRFDLLGRGLSDRPETEYGIELYSEQILQILDTLQIKKPVNLMGLSMAGPIVARFTNEHPERVKRLILQDPLVHKIPAKKVFPLQIPFVGEYLATVVFMPGLIALNTTADHDDKVANWRKLYLQQSRYKGFRRSLVSSLRYLSSHRLVSEYETLSTNPVAKLLVWGTEDSTIPISESETLIQLMPSMEFKAIEGAGHVPSIDKPDEFNQILLDFLQQETSH